MRSTPKPRQVRDRWQRVCPRFVGIGKGAEAPLQQTDVSDRFADLGVQRPAGIAGCELGED